MNISIDTYGIENYKGETIAYQHAVHYILDDRDTNISKRDMDGLKHKIQQVLDEFERKRLTEQQHEGEYPA